MTAPTTQPETKLQPNSADSKTKPLLTVGIERMRSFSCVQQLCFGSRFYQIWIDVMLFVIFLYKYILTKCCYICQILLNWSFYISCAICFAARSHDFTFNEGKFIEPTMTIGIDHQVRNALSWLSISRLCRTLHAMKIHASIAELYLLLAE